METIIECVPNFSEGRDAKTVDAIIEAILEGPDVYLLDKELDADHNRSVITIVGTRESIGEAALRGIGRAAASLDLTRHQGAHPRIGATDVVPFVPVAGATLEDCVRIAERVAEEAWRRFRIPTYLYEAAARTPERRNLENIRRGQFEGLREEIRVNPERRPDFGEAELHPTAGATVMGARKFLIAYNINLGTPDVALAKAIAKKIRTSGGGLACVKAMGVELKARRLAQVSMNLTDFETTPIATVFDAVSQEAAGAGASVVGSEIVGLIPQRALDGAAVHYLKAENFHAELIFENRLAQVMAETRKSGASRALSFAGQIKDFIGALAAPTATPGGGTAAALAGSMAAALGEMVCGLTLRRKSFEAQHASLREFAAHLARLRERLLQNMDHDAASYQKVMEAMKLPKESDAEREARVRAIELASKEAAETPFDTAEAANETKRIIVELKAKTIPQAASDLAVALDLAETARHGGIENVRANLPSIRDRKWLEQAELRLSHLG